MKLKTFNSLGYEVLAKEARKALLGFDGDYEPDLAEYEFQLLLTEAQTDGSQQRTESLPEIGDFKFPLPPLQGNSIQEHLASIAKDLLPKWLLPTIAELLRNKHYELHKVIDLSQLSPGWNKLTNVKTEAIAYPQERYLVFDTETMPQLEAFAWPVMASGLTHNAQYLWLHPALFDGVWRHELVPLGDEPKLIICHNIGYDIARIAETYRQGPHPHFCLCTMSMHQLAGGLDASQRWAMNVKKKAEKNGEDSVSLPSWADEGSAKSLTDAYAFWTGTDVPTDAKDPRKLFVSATSVATIQSNLTALVAYAMGDVVMAYELFRKCWPAYRELACHDAVLVTHSALATARLPIADDWFAWQKRCIKRANEVTTSIRDFCDSLARELLEAVRAGRISPETDAWASNFDWRTACTDSHGEKVPQWFMPMLLNGTLGLTARSRETHWLMRLCYGNNDANASPAIYASQKQAIALGFKSGSKAQGWFWTDEQGKWQKPWHPKGDGINVGCLIAAPYRWLIKQGRLFSLGFDGKPQTENLAWLLEQQEQITYWQGIKDRVNELQPMQVYNKRANESMLQMATCLIPHQTISLRTGHRLWSTLASYTAPKIGSCIKNNIKAPKGYKIVTFDYDSHELYISSAFADSLNGVIGSSPFTKAILLGDSKKGTDMHSLTAKAATEAAGSHVSRDAGKQNVYGMLYGAGFKTSANTIAMWHPEIDTKSMTKAARATLKAFKGEKLGESMRVQGGLASNYYNAIADMLESDDIRTPVLLTGMPPALTPAKGGGFGKPGQINWCIQSSASTGGTQAAAITSLLWLAKHYGIDAQLAMLLHDELVWVVRDDQAELFAFCCQIAVCWTYGMLYANLGMRNLPTTVAFLSGVSIDRIWRKKPKQLHVTSVWNQPMQPGKELSMSDFISQT